MAIHSSVISCHINTYISGSYYKTSNGGASWLHWGFFKDIWQNITGCVGKKKKHPTLTLILRMQDKRLPEQTGSYVIFSFSISNNSLKKSFLHF